MKIISLSFEKIEFSIREVNSSIMASASHQDKKETMQSVVAKEDQNKGAAVNAFVSKKRPVEDSVALAGPTPKVKKDTNAPKTKAAPNAKATPNAKAAPNKTGAVSRGARKTTTPIDVIAKLSECLAAVRSQQERDEAYNKMKLEEVKTFLDTLSRPNILKAVPDCILSEDAPSLLNLLLDALGESIKHGNRMVFATMKAIVKNMGDNEAVPKEKFSGIHKVIYVHNQCQLDMKQHFEILGLLFAMRR